MNNGGSARTNGALVTESEALDAVRVLLRYIGEDPGREGLVETPSRVLKSWRELYGGYDEDPAAALERTFEDVAGFDEMIVLTGVEFHSHCEHHMIPMTGAVDIGYVPDGRVVGLSKLAKVVDGFARRLQTQEALTAEIAEAIHATLRPKGLGVIVRATHHCMVARGVAQNGAHTVTQTMRGTFAIDAEEEARFFRLLEAGSSPRG